MLKIGLTLLHRTLYYTSWTIILTFKLGCHMHGSEVVRILEQPYIWRTGIGRASWQTAVRVRSRAPTVLIFTHSACKHCTG